MHVSYFANASLSTALSEVKTSSRGMCHNVATDGLLGIGIEHGCSSIYLSNNLVSDNHGNAKLKDPLVIDDRTQ
jgi:hypothetical protein